jgi:peroxiredoxin
VKRNQWVVLLVFAALALMVWSGITNLKRRKELAHAPSPALVVPENPGNQSVQQDVSSDEGLPNLRGKAAPDFTLHTTEGKKLSLSDYKGKAVLINFWATWCAPCQREIPLLKTLAGEWASHDVTVVGIAVDYRDKVLQFRDQFKIGYPLLIGEQDALDAAAKFGMASPAFPFTVFTDRRGEVVALFVGELHRPQADLIMSAVQSLDKGAVRLAQARQQIAEGLDALAEKT